MILKTIAQLTPVRHRAVIINVSTKEVSTLALLSALRYSDIPILLVDLESNDGSWEHFSLFAETEPRVDLLAGSLKKHGYVLDKIFRETRDEIILLIDSDLEIRDPEIVKRLLGEAEGPNAFGAGAIHGPEWLGRAHGMPEKIALYQERMWIPFTSLRVQPVQEALNEGFSFINRWVPNELPSFPWLSKLMMKRFFLLGAKEIRAAFLRGTRRTYQNERPNLLCCDTGADIFCHLKYDKEKGFTNHGIDTLLTMVSHYHGVTRRQLNKRDKNAVAMDDIMIQVLSRLRQEYGVEL
jgi:glycosyltransferase involved in cell wall biosynthesis